MTNLIGRAIGIATRPKSEWVEVDGESATTQGLLTGYVLPLVVVSAVAGVIGSLFMSAMFGSLLGGFGGFRVPGAIAGVGLVGAVIGAVVSIAATIAITILMGIIIDALATSFGGIRDRGQAMKVAAYGPTAIWLAGIAAIIPPIGGLAVLAAMIWSIFVIHWGVSTLMKPPEDKAVGYSAVVILIWCGVAFLVSMVAGLIMAPFTIGAALSSGML